jgi:phosphoribosylanthranilate isomerase
MKIKLCGFREKKSLQAAIAQNCDFIGFVFCEKSPRFISPNDAQKIASLVPKNITKVAVVVNVSFDFLEEIAQKLHPEFFQFHGNESLEFLQEVKLKFPQVKIIKAFKISAKSDLEAVARFENVADLFLFDGKSAGSGEKFDWSILKGFSSKKNWLLAGGLDVNNIAEAVRETGAKMIDISSGIEEVRGEKSVKLITEFLGKVNSL